MNLKSLGILGCIAGILLFFSGNALAHKVTVFAWVEGDTVFGESKFSGGKRAKGAEVIVRDLQKNEILRTRTDDGGEFSFKIPKRTGMRIELIAGMGHKGEWTIPLEELGEEEETAGSPDAPATAAASPAKAANSNEGAAVLALTEAQLEMIIENAVEKSLNKKLTPVIKMMADLEQKGPSVNDVMGGIGYIFGLMGVAVYFKTRQKKG